MQKYVQANNYRIMTEGSGEDERERIDDEVYE
jgi:hypothetical protein